MIPLVNRALCLVNPRGVGLGFGFCFCGFFLCELLSLQVPSISNFTVYIVSQNVINYVHSMVSCEFSPQFEAHQKMVTVNS